MKRIYSNYSEEDFNMVNELAKELGFPLSSFQHYCVMLFADSRGNTSPTSKLISDMLNNMQKIEVGKTFIVSALLPEVWPTLSRNIKMTLAKQLAISIRKNPDFSVYKVSNGKTTIYVRNK